MSIYEGQPAIIIDKRLGNQESPFVQMDESLVVNTDGKTILSEIPDKFHKVQVLGDSRTWYEIEKGLPKDNEYKVDYINKVVTFNLSNANKQLNFIYKGTGNHYYSTNSIYTKQENGKVVETLEGVISRSVSNFLQPVANFNEIIATYTSPKEGDTVQTENDGRFYRWFSDDQEWRYVQAFNPTQITTLGNEITVANNKIGILSNLKTSNKGSLVGAVNETTEQLAKTKQRVKRKIKEVNYETKGTQHELKRPMVSFVTDDGSNQDWIKLKPLSEQYNIPMVAGIISGWNTGINGDDEKLTYLQDTLGWEIASHTVNHFNLFHLSEEQADYELRKSKEDLESRGYNVKTIIYPHGGNGPVVRRLAKRYYRCGVGVGHVPNSPLRSINNGVIPSFNIRRVGLGSWFDTSVQGLPPTNSLEYYKYRVDQCLEENGWLVFMLHPGEAAHNATQQNYLEQVIQYVKGKNIEITTVDKAFDVFGNVLEIGDYNANHEVTSGKAMNKFGESKNMESLQMIGNTNITNSTPITDFDSGAISVTSFGFTGGGFPTGAGTLWTHRVPLDREQSYQIWFEFGSNGIHRRRWRNNSWTTWEKIITQSDLNAMRTTEITNPNVYNGLSLPTAFPLNKITTTIVSGSGNMNGLPSNAAGILTTYRVGSSEFDRQEFRRYNSPELWSRHRVVGSDAWESWTKISAV